MAIEVDERLASTIAGWMPKNARRSAKDGHVHTNIHPDVAAALAARFLTLGAHAGLANEYSVDSADSSALNPYDVKLRWDGNIDFTEHGLTLTDDVASGYFAYVQPDRIWLPNLPSPPQATAGKVTLYAQGDQLFGVLLQGGQAFGPFVIGTSEGFVSGRHHLGSLVATPSLAFYSTDGLLDGVQLTPATTAVSLGANGLMAVHTTGAVIGDDAGVAQINFGISRQFDCLSLTKFRLPDTTSVRMFIGWSNQNLATMVGSDTPGSDSGTANVAVTTTNTTLTDTREAWVVNSWVGAVVTCNGKTMTVTSNTATTLTGASWSGGGNPGNEFAWSIVLSSAQYFGLQKRAGDANWFWVGKGTGVLTRTSSGIAVSTAVKYIRFSHGENLSIVCQLFDSAAPGFVFQNVVAFSGAAMPATTTQLRFIAGVETQAAASRALHHGYTYLIGVT